MRAAARQQAEALVQPPVDLLHRQRPHPRRRQLERQRNAVQPTGRSGATAGAFCARDRELRQVGLRPLDEQPHRLARRQRLPARRRASDRAGRARARDRSSRPPIPSPSRLLASTTTCGHCRSTRVGQLRAGGEQVLAVVQHQQQTAWTRGVRPGSASGSCPGSSRSPSDRGHRLRHEPRIRERGELHQPDAVRIGVQQVGRHLQREARLAAAARSRSA